MSTYLLFKKGDDEIILYPLRDFLKAIRRSHRIVVTSWEDKGIIPIEYQITIKTKPKSIYPDRYYTDRTIDYVSRLFSRKRTRKKQKYLATSAIMQNRQRQLRKIFKEEFERFQDAKFICRIAPSSLSSFRKTTYEGPLSDPRDATIDVSEVIESDENERIRKQNDFSIEE